LPYAINQTSKHAEYVFLAYENDYVVIHTNYLSHFELASLSAVTPGLAGSIKRYFTDKMPSCHPVSTAKPLNETQSTEVNHTKSLTGLIPSWFAEWLSREEVPHPLHRFLSHGTTSHVKIRQSVIMSHKTISCW